jgi:Gram-negative bacterial TonB protein C-terminal
MIALVLLAASLQPAWDAIPTPEGWVPCDRRPVPRDACFDPHLYLLGRYYPHDAWMHHQQGIVAYRVQVDRWGNGFDCRITRSSGFASIDIRTCQILRRVVVYNPARDANGRAVAGVATGRILWHDPRLPPLPAD